MNFYRALDLFALERHLVHGTDRLMERKNFGIGKLYLLPTFRTIDTGNIVALINFSARNRKKAVSLLYRLYLAFHDTRRFALYVYLHFRIERGLFAHFQKSDIRLVEVVHKRLIGNAYLLDDIHLICVHGR